MWLYKDKEVASIEDMPQGTIGFIYKITHLPTGRAYIGRKILQHSLKKKLTKKELAEQTGPGRKPTTKRVVKESDWKTYYGSSKPFLALVKENPKEDFKREILRYVSSKKLLTYYETKELFVNEVLEHPDTFYNDNIASKFFRKDFIEKDLDT